MKRSIFISLLSVLLSAKIFAQTPELVYIRVQEAYKGSNMDAVMITIKPDNTAESVELKKLGKDKSVEENGITVKKEIEKWLVKGFKIITMNSSGGDITSRTEILMKKE